LRRARRRKKGENQRLWRRIRVRRDAKIFSPVEIDLKNYLRSRPSKIISGLKIDCRPSNVPQRSAGGFAEAASRVIPPFADAHQMTDDA
jgi:hypothetical protein